MIAHFGSLGGVLGASGRAVRSITSDEAVELLGAHKAFMAHSLRNRLLDAPITASGKALHRYLVATLADLRSEVVRALYLDAGNRLLSDELLAEGDADVANVSIRCVLSRALELEAVALILVHNHPGGQPNPSVGDRHFTNKLADAGKTMGITLLDHLIVAGSDCVSLRGLGILV